MIRGGDARGFALSRVRAFALSARSLALRSRASLARAPPQVQRLIERVDEKQGEPVDERGACASLAGDDIYARATVRAALRKLLADGRIEDVSAKRPKREGASYAPALRPSGVDAGVRDTVEGAFVEVWESLSLLLLRIYY